MTSHTTVTVWSASGTADPDAGTHHLVTLATPGSSEPGPVIGRITRHPDLGDRLSARLYPTLTTDVHTPLEVGYFTLEAAAAAICTAYDAARLISLTASSDLPDAEPITLIRFDDPCPQPQTVVAGHVAVGDHLHCAACGTHHVLTGAVRTNSVPIYEIPADAADTRR